MWDFFSFFTNASSFMFRKYIPYFHLLFFGILVTCVAWFSIRCFFCLAHLALQNVNKDLHTIFVFLLPKVTKSDQKRKIGWTKHLTNSNWISFFVRVNIIFNFFRGRNRWWTWIWRFCWRCWRAPWWSTGTWWLFLIWFKVFKLLCFFDFSGFDHFFVNGFRWISQLVADGLLWSFSCFNLKSCKILTRNFIK